MQQTKTINDIRLAVLIDADNVSYHYVDVLMPEVARYGLPTIKRIYGDWTSPNLSGWKPLLQAYAIIPIQQFSYTTGKNSTDSALIIDAMDLLYTEKVDAFCLVSSDSDFTRLATRLREAGRKVYGIGEKKTPKPFIAACDKFTYLEVLSEEASRENDELNDSETEDAKGGSAGSAKDSLSSTAKKSKSSRSDKADKEKTEKKMTSRARRQDSQPAINIDRKTKRLILRCIDDVAGDDGWAYLGDVGNLLINIRPDFDPRNYGCSKLSILMQRLDGIDVELRPGTVPNVKIVYIRNQDR